MGRGKLGKGRNGPDGENKGFGKRYVDQDIIDKWDEEAMEKMKNMDSEEDKAEVEKFLKLSPEEKKKMMEEMMPKMMEFFFGGEDPKVKIDGIHEFMPTMMEDCMSGMNGADRKKLLSFCRGMLDQVENKFSK